MPCDGRRCRGSQVDQSPAAALRSRGSRQHATTRCNHAMLVLAPLAETIRTTTRRSGCTGSAAAATEPLSSDRSAPAVAVSSSAAHSWLRHSTPCALHCHRPHVCKCVSGVVRVRVQCEPNKERKRKEQQRAFANTPNRLNEGLGRQKGFSMVQTGVAG